MRITRVELRRTPGITEPLALVDLAPGMNVIVGRNGSGKSSLCRFVRGALWPETVTASTAGEVAFDDDGSPLVAVREHRDVHWSKNGLDVDAPPLPEARFARCFTLGMRDLIGGDATDKFVVSEFRRAMAGGYDVAAVAQERFAKKPAAQKLAASADEADKTLSGLLQRQRDLAEQERRLPQLERDVAAAEDAVRRLPLLQIALERDQAASELAELERRKGALSADLHRVRGDELRTLDELEKDADAARRELADCEQRIAQSKRALAIATGPRVDAVALDAAERDLRELVRIEAEAKAARTEREKHRAYYRSALTSLGVDVGEEDALRVDAEALAAAEGMIEVADAVRARRVNLEARLREVMHPERRPEPARWKKGVDILSYWLAEVRDPGRKTRRTIALVLAIVCLIGAGGLIAAELMLFGGALFGCSIGLLGFFFLAGQLRDADAERERWQTEYTRLRLREPETWTEEDVVDLRGTLEDEWSGQLHDFQLRSVLAADDLRLKADEEALDARRRTLENALHANAGDGSNLALAMLAYRVRELQRMAGERTRAEEAVVQLEAEHATVLARIHAVLVAAGVAPANNAAACGAALAGLKESVRGRIDADAMLAREEPRVKALAEKIAENARRRERVFAEAGVKAGDVATLRTKVDEQPRWKKITDDIAQCSAKVDERGARLAADPALLATPRADLTLELERLDRIAAERKTLVEERARIRAEIRQATAADAVAEALECRAAAKEALADARSVCLDREAGAFLLEGVAREFVRESRPPVVKKAQQLFARFTANAYRLDVGDESDELCAVDATTDEPKTLEQLSDGTRIQLLLAARLAYASQAERGTKLPLFLDEVLTTADGDRFRAIAQALLVMAEDERRQVFYLSANPMDVKAWEAFAAEQPDGKCTIRAFDLDDVRGRARAASLDLADDDAREVPAPAGTTPEAYAMAIGAAPFNPWRPASAQHVFWLARHDLEALHALLRARVTTVGQWRQLCAGGGASAVVGADRAVALDAYADVLDRYAQAFAEGRGKAIDADMLIAAGVSDQFVERLSSLARDLGGDPRKLIAAIDTRTDERTRNFKSRDKLVAWMKEHGVLDERAALDEVAIRGRVLKSIEERLAAGAVIVDAVVKRVRELWRASEGRGGDGRAADEQAA